MGTDRSRARTSLWRPPLDADLIVSSGWAPCKVSDVGWMTFGKANGWIRVYSRQAFVVMGMRNTKTRVSVVSLSVRGKSVRGQRREASSIHDDRGG